MKKRIVSLLLAVFMLLAAMNLPLLAAPATAKATSDLSATMYVDTTYAVRGTTVDIAVRITENPGIAGAEFTASFHDALTLVKAQSGDVFRDLQFTPQGTLSNPCHFVWDSENSEATETGEILILSFLVSEDAPADELLYVDLSYSYGNVYDENEVDITIDITNGGVRVIDYIPGDVNGDEVINTKDVRALRRYIAGGYGEVINVSAADVNSDGSLNTKDVRALRRYLAGGYGVELLPSLPSCEHSLTATAAQNPTCTEDGHSAYWYCTLCGNYFADAAGTITVTLAGIHRPATGHTYNTSGICSVCGHVSTDTPDDTSSRGLAFTSYGDGTCYVSGIGTCTDAKLIIPSTSPSGDRVVAIGANAFDSCFKLTSVVIPDGVYNIGNYAFAACCNMMEITIPDGVTGIGRYAFYDCDSLREIVIPDSVTSIGSRAFYWCSSLKQIVIPDGVQAINEGTFLLCYALTDIYIPSSVTYIGGSAFGSCYSLTNIYYDSSISEWESIQKSNDWDDETPTYTIYCTDGSMEKVEKAVTHLSFDELRINDTMDSLFMPGTSKNWSHTATIDSAVTSLKYWGWIGIMGEIGVFGYQIDDGDIIYDESFTHETEEAVFEAAAGTGADTASRMLINIDLSNTDGEHTIRTYYKNPDGQETLLSEFVVNRTSAPSYTVTFQDWDGTIIRVQIVWHGTAASAPEAPHRDGYYFTGWSVDISCVTEDLIAVAQYEKISSPVDPNPDAVRPSDAGLIQYNIDHKTADNRTADLVGWIGFDQPIDLIGYAVDDSSITWNKSGINYSPEEGVKRYAGEYAVRFEWQASLSGYSYGDHTVTYYILLADQTIVRFYSMDVTIINTDTLDELTYDFDSAVEDDLSTLFEFTLGLESYKCDYTSAPYVMNGINQLTLRTDGSYIMTLSNLKTENGHAAVLLRGIPKPDFGDPNYYGHDGNNTEDNLSVGCAGIYVGIVTIDGSPVLRINVKGNENGLAVPHIYLVPMNSYDLIITDDNHVVTFREGSTVLATVTLTGDADGYATQAVVALADGTTETLDQIAVAASVLSDIGFIARSVDLTFDALTLKGWSGEDMPEVPETHIVTFRDWDNTVLQTLTVQHGTAATAPAAPTREGYIFIGWDTAFDAVTGDLTVTALYEKIASTNPTFEIATVQAAAGQSGVAVTIAVKNNPGIASMNLVVSYAEGLTLTDIAYNTSIGGMFQQPQTKDSPVILNWFNGTADSTGDWVFATLTFDVAADASGECAITLQYDPNNVYDITETNIAFDVVAGKIVIS